MLVMASVSYEQICQTSHKLCCFR